MSTRSRSFLLSLVAGLMLAAGSVGCDVEDSTSSEEGIEDVESYSDDLASGVAPSTDKTLLDVRSHRLRPMHVARGEAVGALADRREAKTGPAPSAADAPTLEVKIDGVSHGVASFGFEGEPEEEQTGLLTLGSTKSEPDPDPWNPGEPDPDPWMPTRPGDKDDRY